MKKRLFLLMTMIMVVGIEGAWASSAHFYLKPTKSSPQGGGVVYVERPLKDGIVYSDGGTAVKEDKVNTNLNSAWYSVWKSEASMENELSNKAGKDNGDAVVTAGKTCALYVYFYAKANKGFQFDGFYSDDGTTKINTGSNVTYTGGSSSKNGTMNANGWANNVENGSTTVAMGEYGGYHYLRYVPVVNSDGVDITYYAKFSVIPRSFTLAKMDFPGLSYTAAGQTVTNSADVVTSKLSSNISLSLTNLDTETYTFLGWYYTCDGVSTPQLISNNASDTYSWVNKDGAARDNVKIICSVKKNVTPEATVIEDGVEIDFAEDAQTGRQTFAEAWAYANASTAENVTFKVGKAQALTSTLTATRSMTIDLNNCELSSTAAISKVIDVNGAGINVTLTDNSSTGAGKVSLTNALDAVNYAVFVTNGSLTIEKGTYSCKYTGSTTGSAKMAIAAGVASGKNLTINSGSFTGTSNTDYAYAVRSEGKTVINAGEYNATATNHYAYGIYHKTGTLSVNGGTFKVEAKGNHLSAAGASYAYGIRTDAAATIANASITAKASKSSYGEYAYGIYLGYSSGTGSVTGCTISATASIYYAYGIYVTNGTNTLTDNAITVHNPNVNGTTNKGGGSYTYGVLVKNGTTTISGGSIDITSEMGSNYCVYREAGTVKLTGDGKYKNAGAEGANYDVYGAVANTKVEGGFFCNYGDAAAHKAAGKDVYALPADHEQYPYGYRYYVTDIQDMMPWRIFEGATSIDFYSLSDALAYATNNPSVEMTIMMNVSEHTLEAGNYIVPKNATLIVPFAPGQNTFNEHVVRTQKQSSIAPAFKLTFADNVTLTLLGKMELGGYQYARTGQTCGHQAATFAQLTLGSNCRINVEDGARLNVWGYILGDRETSSIHVKNGGMTYELFQVADWKGGNAISANGLYNGGSSAHYLFPVNSYFIQNICVPTTYYGGAICRAEFGTDLSDNIMRANDIGMIGTSDAMFLMRPAREDEGIYVIKDYNPATDRVDYKINSSASIGSMTLDFGGQTANSKNFYLPVAQNMSIHLLSGTLNVSQSMVLNPGAEMEIEKEATCIIPSGVKLFLYDTDEWGKYAYSGYYARGVYYSPSWTTNPRSTAGIISKDSKAKLPDAAINLHGTLDVRGAIYTTEGGANIFSTNDDAGTVQFSAAAAANGTIDNATKFKSLTGGETDWTSAVTTSAKLKNGNGEYVATSGTAAGKSFCYIMDAWRSMTTSGCFAYDEANEEYFAKPNEYVAVTSNIEDAEHLYHSKVGERLFILTEGCQWWEVVPQNGYYYCADNDTYYVYNEGTSNWEVVKLHVSWLNYDGTYLQLPAGQTNSVDGTRNAIYDVAYGAHPEYLGTQPVKPMVEGYYTYTFAGWLPEITADTKVTEDMTFTAQFETHAVRYTIIFLDENDQEVDRVYVARDEVPACHADMTKDGYSLVWMNTATSVAGITAVTGDATYKATYKSLEATEFTITFLNYDGTVISSQVLAKNTLASAIVAPTPTKSKPSIADEDFEFAGWTPELENVTRDMTYTAKYDAIKKTYLITFLDADGTELQSSNWNYNVTPSCPAPTKESDADYVYTFSHWNPAIVPATKPATYTAEYDMVSRNLEVGVGEVFDATTNPTVNSISLSATVDASGEIINAGALPNTVNAYFDLSLNIVGRQWYAVAVPWQVDATSGISIKGGKTLVLGTDEDVVYYDGEKRATMGAVDDVIVFLEDLDDRTMYPGKMYFLYFASNLGDVTLRFAKMNGAPVLTNSVSVATYAASNSGDASWNGIANPTTYKALLDAGVTYGQIYSAVAQGYTTVELASTPFVVGRPVMVQAETPQSVVITRSGASSAPLRVAAQSQDIQVGVELSKGEKLNDRVYIKAMTEKEDSYVIGTDLGKAGISSRVAQMWINRYNTKLAVNAQELVENSATYPLVFSAPAAGEYNLHVNAKGDAQVYLMNNDQLVWNLSMSDYTIDLKKGNTTGYALRLVGPNHITTDMQGVSTSAEKKVQKVIIDSKLFLLREGQVYDAVGKIVK